MESKVITYTVYKNAIDYPDDIVVRRFFISSVTGTVPDQNIFLKGKDLNGIRLILMGMGLVLIPRDESDSPAIVETWI